MMKISSKFCGWRSRAPAGDRLSHLSGCAATKNFSFSPVEGEVILHHLEEKDIYVGLGSACSAHSKQPSKILTGIGLSVAEARCSLRVSFSRHNTLEEVDVFIKEFARAYEFLYPTFCSALTQ
jgi:cysteine desulfurase